MKELSELCSQLAKRKLEPKELQRKRAVFIRNEQSQKASHKKLHEQIAGNVSGITIAAAIQLRKGMQDLKGLAQDIRAEVQDKKKDD